MKVKSILCLALSALTAFSAFSVSAAAEESKELTYYVSPSGSDSAEGTEQAPFATVAHARDAIRTARAAGEHATVILRDGIYVQDDTLLFSSEDGDVTYKAYEGETPVITGLDLLDTSRFTAPRDGDPLVARIKNEEARANVLTYDLSDVTADTAGAALFYGTSRALKARYPNTGYVLGMYSDANGGGVSGKTFYDVSNVVSTWDPDSVVGVDVIGNFEVDWSTSEGTISAYNRKSNLVTLKTTSGLKVSGRYYYSNIIEELDVVGEYYVDAASKTLYIYLPEDYKGMEIGFARCPDDLVRSEADGLEFDGICFEGSEGRAIRVEASDNVIRNCTIRFAEDGVSAEGFRNIIDNNEIYRIGGTGVSVSGGDEKLLIPSDTKITNNLIHDFAETHRVYHGALGVGGIGIYAAHNEMHTGPHLAISDAAKDFICEYNYIHDVCYEAGDAGAIYLGGFSCNGGVYRCNLIKDIHSYLSVYYRPNGFYNDDGGSGKTFTSNIVMDVDGSGIAIGGGRDNTITNNILINTGFSYDQRGYYPGTGSGAGWTLVQRYLSGNWLSLVPWHSDQYGYVNHTPAYGTKTWAYRNAWVMLMKTTDVPDLNNNFVSYGFGTLKVNNNILATYTESDYPASYPEENKYTDREFSFANNPVRLGSFRDNLEFDMSFMRNSLFVDYDGGDYRVREDSDIYRLIPGFRACDASLIGRTAEN